MLYVASSSLQHKDVGKPEIPTSGRSIVQDYLIYTLELYSIS